MRPAGLDTVVGRVGACSRADCRFIRSLECTAQGVRVGAGAGGDHAADCLIYSPA